MNDTVRLAIWPLGAAAAGVVAAGIGIAVTVAVANGIESDTGWEALGAVVMGGFVSIGLGGLVWLSMLTAGARRLFMVGERLAPVVQSVGGVFGVVVLGWAFERMGAGGGAGSVIGLAGLAVLVVPPLVFLLRGRTTPRPGPPPEWPLPPR